MRLLKWIVVLALVTVAASADAFNTSRSGALANKVAEIKAACGSRVVSGYRPNARTPSGRLSDHALGLAVDVAGNPSCIYSRLRNWPGGYTTDYATAPGTPHVHISYNPSGPEWGRRFAHSRAGVTSYASARRRGYHPSRVPVLTHPVTLPAHSLPH